MSKGKTVTETTASLPAFQEEQFKKLFAAAQGVSQQPFIPYTGPMVAGFSPDQLRQFQATRGLFESSMAADPTRAMQRLAGEARPVTGPAASLLGQDIGAYQSPYQQQVIDATMKDIQRQADIARGGAQERAIRAGAFGGSRSAILESESQRPFVEAMARTAAEQRERGYGQALRSAEADVARQQQMAMFAPELDLRARQQQAGLLGGQQGQPLHTHGLLGGMGAQQRGLQQQAIDAQRGEFFRALGYGPSQIGLLQGGMGTPLVQQTTTGQKKTGVGDVLGTLAGMFGGAMLGGMFGGGAAAGSGATGAATTAGGGRGYFSDERLKENITPIGVSENGHKLYTWDWNDKAKELGINDPTTGVIAQEVIKYMPEAISKNTNGYYMVNYGVL